MNSIAEKGFNTKRYFFRLNSVHCYKIILSLFQLNLLNDDWNKNSDIVSTFVVNDNELNDETTNNTKLRIMEKLKQMGAKSNC